ncbi:glycosyltransferase family 2 protein [Gracilibacillus phocaeensis]|uniref:glycosyltransferase family 2 protein n=1 Tax=Gracilibacillus phocaeensis TaxID=2042304 RepID=UPI001030413B|nr:glycosyltransferase family 2 protein [Gracilibacillus phocaeensis]
MTIEISMIVPVYNLEKFLPKCIDSILAQTFQAFELILVNDGSTDASGELCDAYAKRDKRVKVIHKENGGVASSRNAGLEMAKGRYIGFVDNDDYINEQMLELLYTNAMKYDSDMVACDFVKVNEDQLVDRKCASDDYKIQHFTNIEALHQIYETNALTFICPWNKLYKKSLFQDIRYEVGNINDDETVVHKLLDKSEKTTYIQTPLYYYVQRKDSQIHSLAYSIRFGAVSALKDREVYFRKRKLASLHQKALKHYMEKFFWYYFLAKSDSTDRRQALKMMKRSFDRTLFYLLLHKEMGWKQKVMCVIFCVHPSLFERINHIPTKKRQLT